VTTDPLCLRQSCRLQPRDAWVSTWPASRWMRPWTSGDRRAGHGVRRSGPSRRRGVPAGRDLLGGEKPVRGRLELEGCAGRA